MGENKNYRFVPFLPDAEQKMPKKKLKKLKNTIIASFQANIVWKRPRKIEKKIYRVVTFLPDALQKIPKKQQKNKKNKKNSIVASFQAKIVWKRKKKERE